MRGTGNRQRPEQQRVDDREDGGVEADGDGQRHGGGEGEARTPARAPQRIADVAEQVLQRAPAAGVPHRLADGVGAAQAHVRTPPGLAEVHAGSQVVLGLHLQMEPQLCLCLRVLAPAAKEASQPRDQSPNEAGKQAHFRPSSRFQELEPGINRFQVRVWQDGNPWIEPYGGGSR